MFIKILIASILLGSLSYAEETKTHHFQAKVDGMVCAMCVQSIKLRLNKEKEIQTVKIDMNTGLVDITLQPGAELSNKKLSDAFKESGYPAKELKQID